MRVLLLSDWMSNQGGAERYIVSLRDSLRASGDEVNLLVCGDRSADSGEADVRAFGSDRMAARAVLQLGNPFAVGRVRKMVRQFRPEIALVSHFAYHLSPLVLNALRGVPTVVSLMDYKTICPLGTRLLPDDSVCGVRAGYVCHANGCVGLTHWLRDQPRYALMRAGMRRADRILCPSAWVQRELAAGGVCAEVVTLGVCSPGPQFRHEPGPVPTFVYCGRLSHEKGVVLLLEAFAALRAAVPAARLRLVGDGPVRGEITRKAAALGVAEAITITGWLPALSVETELADAWALVAPSLWAEPFGLSVVEAMVRGIPVITSDHGAFLETVEPGVSGLMFSRGSAGELHDRMRAIASSEAFPSRRLRPEVAEQAATRFGMERHMERLRSVFDEIAGSLTGPQ